MVDIHPAAAFGQNRIAASIDTPLHAFIRAGRSSASRLGDRTRGQRQR
jgi:hypothetical protein